MSTASAPREGGGGAPAHLLRIFASVTPEFASPLGTGSVGMRARSAVVSSLVDGILIAGPMAGVQPGILAAASGVR